MIVLGVVVLAWVVGIVGGWVGVRQVEFGGVGGGVAVVALPVVDVHVVVVVEEMLLVLRLGAVAAAT